MRNDVWLTAVIALSGVVLLVLVAVLVWGSRGLWSRRTDGSAAVNAGRDSNRTSGRQAEGARNSSESPSALTARGLHHVFAGVAPRRARSVEGNLARAYLRIDSVDPYEAPRRIGLALADTGLLEESPQPWQHASAEARPDDVSPNTWPLRDSHRTTEHSEDQQ